MSRKLPGLRAGIITYVLIVLLALGGASAHALWSQRGTVTVNVTAGTWGPTGTVEATTVMCGQRIDRHKESDITVTWKAVRATGYRLEIAPPGFMVPATVLHTGAGEIVSTKLILTFDDNSGKGTYPLTITPTAGGLDGTPTVVNVEFLKNPDVVRCR